MSTEFSQVSLGFAEFVGQLLHETFDAVLGAHAHQAEKAAELQAALLLSTEEFAAQYVAPEDLQAAEVTLFGQPLVEKMRIAGLPLLIERMQEVIPEAQWKLAFARGTLTTFGFDTLRLYALETVVAARKARMKTTFDQVVATRLVVDSGEVKARLELSSLYQSESGAALKAVLANDVVAAPITSLPDAKELQLDGVLVKEVTDSATAQKTILIDYKSLRTIAAGTTTVPNVRLVATPARHSSSAAILSEVTIRFKTA